MTIEGFFGSIKDANETADKLKSEGFKAYVDSNSHYIDDTNMKTDMIGTEAAPSLSALVMKSGEPFLPRDKAPLMAASPMVSGYGRFEPIASYRFKVVVATDNDESRAKQTITEMGGELMNPNIDLPKSRDDINDWKLSEFND